jgi:hypothetical protein
MAKSGERIPEFCARWNIGRSLFYQMLRKSAAKGLPSPVLHLGRAARINPMWAMSG